MFLAMEGHSLWVSVSNETLLMEKRECFRVLPRGPPGKKSGVCVCMGHSGLGSQDFPCHRRTKLSCPESVLVSVPT